MINLQDKGLTISENRMYFGLWALMKAPLLLSSNLPKLSAALIEIANNTEVIAVNQDSLGVQVSERLLCSQHKQASISVHCLTCLTHCRHCHHFVHFYNPIYHNASVGSYQARKLSIDNTPVPWLVGLAPCDSAPATSHSRNSKMNPLGSQSMDNREWTVKKLPGGNSNKNAPAAPIYQIVNGATSRCLATNTNSAAVPEDANNYSPVVLLPCNASSATQQWSFGKGLHSPTSVVNAATGKALGIANSTLFGASHGKDVFPVSDVAYGRSGLVMVTSYDQPNCTSRDCQNYDPSQMWYYSPSEQLLRHSTYMASINHRIEGAGYTLTEKVPTWRHHCLAHSLSTCNFGTVAGELEVWGGPLSAGAFVVGVLNRGVQANATVVVDWSMFEGALDPSAKYGVRDLWAHAPIPAAQMTASGFVAQVGSHDIAIFKVTPHSSA
jgi:hypothetical protein